MLNVTSDSLELVKIYVNITETLPKDEYSFAFNISTIVIPTLSNKKETISGGITSLVAFQLEMYGHYREETQADVEKRVLVKNFTIYEKIDKEEKTEV